MSHNPNAVTTLLLSTDMQGSILGRHSGSPAQGMSYTSFGYTEYHNALGFRLGFNGQRHEPNGLYILGNGYRAYSTKLGRFCSQDSLSPFSRAGLNPYAYCLNDPINRNDPSGHISKNIRKSIIKTFRTNATKLSDRRAALDAIEADLRPLTTALVQDPAQVSREQRLKVEYLVARASKKSRGIYDLGGRTSHEFDELYRDARTLVSIWQNPDLFQITRTTRGSRSNSIESSHSSPIGDPPPDYDSLPSQPKPPSYSEAIAAMKNAIRESTN